MDKKIITKPLKEIGLSAVKNICQMTVNYAISEIKNFLGKEYLFRSNDDEVLDSVISNFIKKYDPKFSRHSQKTSSGKFRIRNKKFMFRLDSETFCYIASGSQIPKANDLIMLEDGVYASDLYMYIFGVNVGTYSAELLKLVDDAIYKDSLGLFTVDASGNKLNSSSLEFNVTYQKLIPREISTVFFSHGEKDTIINHLDKFKKNEKFYKDRQIIYKTGILLYGEPGTGKSSLAKVLATNYHRSIVNINVSNFDRIDIPRLTQSINADTMRKYIILLEDIDTLYLNRESAESNRGDLAVTNKLLQFLDSNTSPNDVIFVATTNHVDRLDAALLREGRFDLKVCVRGLEETDAVTFCKSFGLNEEASNETVKEAISRGNDKDELNQALLQTLILSRIEDKPIETKLETMEEENENSDTQ